MCAIFHLGKCGKCMSFSKTLVVCLLGLSFGIRAVDLSATQLLQHNLWLECSCMHARERNGHFARGTVTLNTNTIRAAKNNCFLVFITGLPDEIVALRFKNLQLLDSCSDYIELFPYLRELVIENSTKPEYVICNSSSSIRSNQLIQTHDVTNLAAKDLFGDEFIYSAGKIFGIRMRFKNAAGRSEAESLLNLNVEYRFLKKENFRTNGRLLKGSYCDYYFFAHADNSPISADIWQYFHSPRFPAKYPAHIKCAYKFIGRPSNVVEIVFEELHLPKQTDSCNMDTLTIFDAETANMNDVIDVICWHHVTKRAVSTGPDLLIEFNASSNITAKGFRGRFRFVKQIPQNTTNISKDNATKTIKAQLPSTSSTLKNWGYYFEVTGK